MKRDHNSHSEQTKKTPQSSNFKKKPKMKTSLRLSTPLIALAMMTHFASANLIPSPFIDTTYRIERGFVAPDTAGHLFEDLLHKGLPGSAPSDP